jgi:hypothetical protein
MRFFIVLSAGLLIAAGPAPGGAAPASGKKKVYFTYPQPPKVKPDDPMRVDPGTQVPEHPERYVWKVSGKIRGKVVYPSAVPVYAFDDFGGGRPTRIGEVPVGTEVKLETIHPGGRIHYYVVPFSGSTRTAWMNGLYIEPAGYTPPDK